MDSENNVRGRFRDRAAGLPDTHQHGREVVLFCTGIIMKKSAFLLPAAAAVGIFLAACLSSPTEPGTGSNNGALSCASSEKSFNGGCHDVCTTSADCSKPGESCMTIAEGQSICLDYSQCGYFASDTSCSGVPYSSAEYPYSGEDPYWTPDPDPYTYFETGYGDSTPYGCTGNAPFRTAAPISGADPKCGEKHDVQRCEKVDNRCAIVSGSTIDVAER